MSGVSFLLLATKLPRPGVIAAALLGGLAVVLALALLMRRRPEAFPLLVVLALPFRLPIAADGRTVNLLVPLYLVVAAGGLARLMALRSGRAAELSPEGGAAEEPGTPRVHEPAPGSLRRPSGWLSPRGLEWLLLASVVLYAAQAAYSADHAKAAENIAFFYLPFGLLFVLLRDVRWTRELLLACLGRGGCAGGPVRGCRLRRVLRKTLFLNPKVVAANQYDNYFRVNSVFFDPSIYGRFLALVMIMVTTVVLWSRRRRDVLLGAAVLAWLMAGLITSFSESSIAALLLGLAVLAAFRWDVRGTIYVVLALLAIAVVILLAAPSSLHFGLKGSGASANNATSGRTNLVSGGLELFADRPLQGYGSGSFETEYERHGRASVQNATSASHTIPVTVAAEQGIVGLALYAALLVVAFVVLFRDAARAPPRIAIAACFAALMLHTWTYADFLEDPLTWTLLAVGVACARAPGSIWGRASVRAAGGSLGAVSSV